MTRSGAIITIALLGLVLFLALFLTPGGLELRVALAVDNTPVLVLPLTPGERFTIHYFHSVEHAPIWEEHSMDETGRLFIEEERYEKFGAGMGKMPGVGRMVTKGPYEAIVDMHMEVGDFTLRVGSPGVDHTLIWRGRRYCLTRVFSLRAVTFKGRPISLLEGLWRDIRGRQPADPFHLADPS